MSADTIKRPPRKRVLIVSSSGGGAHLSAATALEERLRAESRTEEIHTVDLLEEWAGPVGRLSVRIWNHAMRRGSSRQLNLALRLQHLGDVILGPFVRGGIRQAIRRWRIDQIFDCQVMATRTLLSAAASGNGNPGEVVPLTKVLVEPAHAAAVQYRNVIRRLPDSLRRGIRLWASPPLLAAGETEEQFWTRGWGLDPGQVETTSGFPVRAPFRSVASDAAAEPLTLSLRQAGAPSSGIVVPAGNGDATITVPAAARLVTVLMGSQGTGRFTWEAVTRILDRLDDPNLWLVVYVPDARQRQEICRWAERRRSRTTLVALRFIEASTLARLYRRSDATVTRSGGMTSMELLSAGRAPALIYSSGHRHRAYAGMVTHEYGNFLYLQRFHPAGALPVDAQDLDERLGDALRNGSGPRGKLAPNRSWDRCAAGVSN